MRRLVIAVDCDDVLVKTGEFFVTQYNQQYGTNVTLERSHDGTYDGWGVDHATMLERFGEMLKTDEYKALGPEPEEIQILKELAKDHELHVVTARRAEERAGTQAMIDRDVPQVFQSLELVGFEGSKGDVCRRLGVDVLIDDNVRHLQDAVDKGLPSEGALLFGEYPWNTTSGFPDPFLRCPNWESVKQEINRLANR